MIKKIIGGTHLDQRGQLDHFNNFDMTAVKRFYVISIPDTQQVRAWQGHKEEAKWFYCTEGEFELQVIQIDNWESPSKKLTPDRHLLSSKEPKIIKIPGGYVNGFRATLPNSKMMVFSDATLEKSKNDDFRFEINYWNYWK